MFGVDNFKYYLIISFLYQYWRKIYLWQMKLRGNVRTILLPERRINQLEEINKMTSTRNKNSKNGTTRFHAQSKTP